MKNWLLLILLFEINPIMMGWYNQTNNQLYCTDEYSCLHEIGHVIDQRWGYSESEEFIEATTRYSFPGINQQYIETDHLFLPAKWGGHYELYAVLLTQYYPDYPDRLKQFYSLEEIEPLLKTIEYNEVLHVQ